MLWIRTIKLNFLLAGECRCGRSGVSPVPQVQQQGSGFSLEGAAGHLFLSPHTGRTTTPHQPQSHNCLLGFPIAVSALLVNMQKSQEQGTTGKEVRLGAPTVSPHRGVFLVTSPTLLCVNFISDALVDGAEIAVPQKVFKTGLLLMLTWTNVSFKPYL